MKTNLTAIVVVLVDPIVVVEEGGNEDIFGDWVCHCHLQRILELASFICYIHISFIPIVP